MHDIVREDEKIQQLRFLTRHQGNLIKEQTRIKNRLQKLIRGYFPEYFEIISSEQLTNYNSLSLLIECFEIKVLKSKTVEEIAKMRAKGSKSQVGNKLAEAIKTKVENLDWQPKYTETICKVIASEAKRLLELKKEIQNLDDEIERLDIRSVKIIDSYPGAGIRSAGRLVAELVDITRYHSSDSVALYLGIGGINDESGKMERVISSQRINHRGKAAIMDIAFASIQWNEESKKYYAKMREKGKPHWEAVKCLARQIIKVLYAMLVNDQMYDSNHKATRKTNFQRKLRKYMLSRQSSLF